MRCCVRCDDGGKMVLKITLIIIRSESGGEMVRCAAPSNGRWVVPVLTSWENASAHRGVMEREIKTTDQSKRRRPYQCCAVGGVRWWCRVRYATEIASATCRWRQVGSWQNRYSARFIASCVCGPLFTCCCLGALCGLILDLLGTSTLFNFTSIQRISKRAVN